MPLVPGEYDDALTAFLWNNLLGVNWIKFQLALEIIFQESVNHHPSSPKKYPTKKWAHHPQLILVFHTKLHAIWVFPKIVVPQKIVYFMENPKMDDLGGKKPIFGNTLMLISYRFCFYKPFL